MSFFKEVSTKGQVAGAYFWCNGCQKEHFVALYTPDPNDRVWTLSGTEELPTLKPPAIVIDLYNDKGDPAGVCKSKIDKGQLVFTSDSSHKEAGHSVAMVAFSQLVASKQKEGLPWPINPQQAAPSP